MRLDFSPRDLATRLARALNVRGKVAATLEDQVNLVALVADLSDIAFPDQGLWWSLGNNTVAPGVGQFRTVSLSNVDTQGGVVTVERISCETSAADSVAVLLTPTLPAGQALAVNQPAVSTAKRGPGQAAQWPTILGILQHRTGSDVAFPTGTTVLNWATGTTFQSVRRCALILPPDTLVTGGSPSRLVINTGSSNIGLRYSIEGRFFPGLVL